MNKSRANERTTKTAWSTAGSWRALCQCRHGLARPVAMFDSARDAAKKAALKGLGSKPESRIKK